MDNTTRTEYRRIFLFDSLPEPLTPASEHIQLFDNYIHETRLRLRSIRYPQTKTWRRSLEKLQFTDGSGISICEVSAIELSEYEHAVFEPFEGTEIRKNRYESRHEGRAVALDIYLGKLWGLNRGRIDFASEMEMRAFRLPDYAAIDVSDDQFFYDGNLVNLTFADVQARVAEMLQAKEKAG
ncbi:MAG: hypothetical protein H0V76_10675 [Blastocatellia bacterium]|nr:hypothetical protein [Blastocatellia bacterium]